MKNGKQKTGYKTSQNYIHARLKREKTATLYARESY